MSRICSDNPQHKSNTDDFCSICGAPVSNGGQSNDALQNVREPYAQPSQNHSSTCPTCGIASVPGDSFCANCGTEYSTGFMVIPEAEVAPTQNRDLAPASPATLPPLTTSISGSESQIPGATIDSLLRAILVVDLQPRQGREQDAIPPADCGERVFILDKEILPFGRTSSWMPIPDAGASRNHGEFLRNAQGYYGLRDVGSANGTLLNGVPLKGQEIKKIKAGDTITVGFWHTIRIE